LLLKRIWQERLRSLRAVAFTVLTDPAAVEDVLQETFTRVFQRGRAFQTEDEAFNYLRRAVINNSIDAFRKQQRNLKRFRQREYQGESPEIADSQTIDPLEILIREENHVLQNRLAMEVRRAVGKLPQPQREAIRLFFGKNSRQNVKEVCRRKGIPYSTVRSRMLKGIDNIRRQLQLRGMKGFTPF